MFEAPSALFSMVGVVYGLVVPLVILHLVAMLFIPVMVSGTGAKVMSSGRAIYCYLLQALGILLMTIGGLPAVYGVLAREPYDSSTYLALLIVFSAGGLTFLWHDHLAHTVDSASRSVPHAIYFFTFKVIGYLLTLLSAVSLLLTMLLGTQDPRGNWWVMPVLLLFYGLLLSWCTRQETETMSKPFQSSPMGLKGMSGFPIKGTQQKGKIMPVGKKK